MAKPIQFKIKESVKELRIIQRKSIALVSKRILILIELKKHEKTGISKRDLSALTGVNHNSITTWRNLYMSKGLTALLTHNKKGFKKTIITKQEHIAMETKLKDPKNGLRGYIELLDWLNTSFNKNYKYITILKYAQRNFETKIKVARKSHVNKDEEAVDTFKKSSITSYKK